MIGTYGEQNLVDAALHNFSQAVHLQCFQHLQQNIEIHLYNEQFPMDIVKKYIHDIFGWCKTNRVYHKGLMDSSDADSFDAILDILKER